jgi:hypothetical protein
MRERVAGLHLSTTGCSRPWPLTVIGLVRRRLARLGARVEPKPIR